MTATAASANTASNLQATPSMIKVKRIPIQEGDAGIARTVALMRKLVAGDEGAANPEVRRRALQIIKDVPSGDRAGERSAIFNWVKQNLKFRGEYMETLQSPVVTMQLGAGDCDDHSTLMAALLEAVGHETAFKTVATDGHRDFSHVYTLAHDRSGEWIPLDTTVATSYPGWESPRITRSKVWATHLSSLRGLGSLRTAALSRQRMRGLNGLGDVNDVFNNLQPLINAAAIRLAYGSNAGYQPFAQNLSPQTQIGGASFSSIPTWVPWAVGLGFLAVFVNGLKGGRR